MTKLEQDYKTKLWWVLHNAVILSKSIGLIIKQSCGGYYTTKCW